MRQLCGLALEAAIWWGLCLGVWLVSLSAVSDQELAVAVPVSMACGLLAVAARKAAGSSWRFRPRWMVSLYAVPIAIVADTFAVLASVLRRRGGSFVQRPLAEGAGDSPRASGRRAAATLLVTLTPGSIMSDVDAEAGTGMVHVLSSGSPRMEELATQ